MCQRSGGGLGGHGCGLRCGGCSSSRCMYDVVCGVWGVVVSRHFVPLRGLVLDVMTDRTISLSTSCPSTASLSVVKLRLSSSFECRPSCVVPATATATTITITDFHYPLPPQRPGPWQLATTIADEAACDSTLKDAHSINL